MSPVYGDGRGLRRKWSTGKRTATTSDRLADAVPNPFGSDTESRRFWGRDVDELSLTGAAAEARRLEAEIVRRAARKVHPRLVIVRDNLTVTDASWIEARLRLLHAHVRQLRGRRNPSSEGVLR